MSENSVLETLETRTSVRSYSTKSVDELLLQRVVCAARRAPTSSNLQAYSLVRVRDPGQREELASLAGGQGHVVDAPVLFAVCADLARLDRAATLRGAPRGSDTFESLLLASIDASLLGMAMSLAAESVGLGTCMIGGLRRDPVGVARVLGLPPRVLAIFGLCIGHPDGQHTPKPRLPEGAVIHEGRYQSDGLDELLDNYDASLANHYRGQGRSTEDEAWTGFSTRLIAGRPLESLGHEVEKLGFRLTTKVCP